MNTVKLAYWFTFAIPGVFIVLRIIVQRLIDGPPWLQKHFYVGVDLSIFSLAATAVNMIDLLMRGQNYVPRQGLMNFSCLIAIVLVLVYQITVHQQWERADSRDSGKTWYLCVVSNLIGCALIGGFIYMKVESTI